LINLKGIEAKQGDFTLKVNSLSLSRGELVAVLGNNGSGKSTFLSVLSGLRPFRGRYLLDGRPYKDYEAIERHRMVSLLPQHSSLNMPFDVQYVVLTGRYPNTNGRGYSEEDIAHTEETLRRLDIYHLRHRQFNELSGGERQRVLLARVINRGSPVMLLDEPLTGVDLRHQHEIVDLLKGLSKDRLILVVVHDISLAVREFERFLFFVNGRLQYDLGKSELDEKRLSEVFQVNVRFIKDEKRIFVYTEGKIKEAL
jgi:iron complex transport system ATP-binding protein